ncbi:MAG TPA: fatty acid CoA ligase family protein [Pirellulales bacterium]|nr:fatty acid CoA ligase family protein [Pirellulales bacterium]
MQPITCTARTTSATVHTKANVSQRLAEIARLMPSAVAIAEPCRKKHSSVPDDPTDEVLICPSGYRCLSFAKLDTDSTNIAAGLDKLGIEPGMRIALLLQPGIDFVSLIFALFKLGAVQVLIDPGMGMRNVIRSLAEVQPQGFIGGSAVHFARLSMQNLFPAARFNVVVGNRWFSRMPTLNEIRRIGARVSNFQPEATIAATPAAIIFTSGSTGPAKGVLYRHGNFDKQVSQIQNFYGVRPGEIDISCFPLFGLFNAAMGVSSIIPQMDVTRPARVDPRHIITAVNDWQATQAFGSPAIWNVVGRYCEAQHLRLPSLRRILSSGAPVAAHILRRMTACIHPEGGMHTPYGATEALPVASIAASIVLNETWARTEQGAGVCVGNRFEGICWRVIRITDDPIPSLDSTKEMPCGQIGELIVQGPNVTTEYVTESNANAKAKIYDSTGFWHRMGDVGYLDERDRFWFCGRMSQRVITSVAGNDRRFAHGPAPTDTTMFTILCEAIFNQHPDVSRSALVGIGLPGEQAPVIVIEPQPGRYSRGRKQREKLIADLRTLAKSANCSPPIHDFLIRKSLPVDVRHNVKINREQLSHWAARKTRPRQGQKT